MASERVAAHRALEAMWKRLYDVFDGARFERRSDLIVALYPPFPIPQCNGPWVVEDSQAAVDALPGRSPRSRRRAPGRGCRRDRATTAHAQRAAIELGLTHTERIPGMVVRPGELAEARADIEIALVGDRDFHETNEILAICFDAPKELFDGFCGGLQTVDDVMWRRARPESSNTQSSRRQSALRSTVQQGSSTSRRRLSIADVGLRRCAHRACRARRLRRRLGARVPPVERARARRLPPPGLPRRRGVRPTDAALPGKYSDADFQALWRRCRLRRRLPLGQA